MLGGGGLASVTLEKISAHAGFCGLFWGQMTMMYLEGDFCLWKAKAPSAVLAEGANSKKCFWTFGSNSSSMPSTFRLFLTWICFTTVWSKVFCVSAGDALSTPWN